MLIDDLYRAMEWSDARMWTAVRRVNADSLREKIYHLHMVQRAFLSVWRGTPERPPQLDSFPDTPAIEHWARGYYPEAHAFIATLDDAAMKRPIVLQWAARITEIAEPGVPTLEQTLMQVVLYTTHHRGQIVSRIRELGAHPPLTDYIAWIWLGRPAAQWD